MKRLATGLFVTLMISAYSPQTLANGKYTPTCAAEDVEIAVFTVDTNEAPIPFFIATKIRGLLASFDNSSNIIWFPPDVSNTNPPHVADCTLMTDAEQSSLVYECNGGDETLTGGLQEFHVTLRAEIDGAVCDFSTLITNSAIVHVTNDERTTIINCAATDSFSNCLAKQDDEDLDGILNTQDNCPQNANEDQADTDFDDIGDACDPEVTCNAQTIALGGFGACCPEEGTFFDIPSKQCLPDTDTDGDGIADVKDQCPEFADQTNGCVATPTNVTIPTTPKPTQPVNGGGGCALQASEEHGTGTYVLLSFIAVLSALGLARTSTTRKE